MAKKIRFPLIMDNDTEVRTLDELQEHFSLERVLVYIKDGSLYTWLKDRYLEDEAAALEALDTDSADYRRMICEILGAEYPGTPEEAEERKRKLALLHAVVDGTDYDGVVDRIAFDQDDLFDLLDEGVSEIYLCGDSFSIPLGKSGITYIGINHPTAVIASKTTVDFHAKRITLRDVSFDEKYDRLLQAKREEAAQIKARSGWLGAFKSFTTSGTQAQSTSAGSAQKDSRAAPPKRRVNPHFQKDLEELCSDFACHRPEYIEADDRGSEKIYEGLCLDEDEILYLGEDCTLFKNGKYGFAITNEGITMRDPRGYSIISYEDLADSEISVKDFDVLADGDPIAYCDSDPEEVADLIRQISRIYYI